MEKGPAVETPGSFFCLNRDNAGNKKLQEKFLQLQHDVIEIGGDGSLLRNEELTVR